MTRQEVKEAYAKQKGYASWKIYREKISTFAFERDIEAIHTIHLQLKLQEAAEGAKLERWDDMQPEGKFTEIKETEIIQKTGGWNEAYISKFRISKKSITSISID